MAGISHVAIQFPLYEIIKEKLAERGTSIARMIEWQNGSMAVWENGSMAVWQYGSMAVWQYGRMAEWKIGKMAVRENGRMGEWRNADAAPPNSFPPDALCADNRSVDTLGAGRLAIASSISKVIASTLTYPHEVIPRRNGTGFGFGFGTVSVWE